MAVRFPMHDDVFFASEMRTSHDVDTTQLCRCHKEFCDIAITCARHVGAVMRMRARNAS